MLFDGIGRSAPKAPEKRDRPSEPIRTPVPSGSPPTVGLVLGGGAARGWAHIGVLRVLDAAGIRPGVIAGSSIGAVVGGCYAAGQLDKIEAFARSLTKRRVMGLLDFHIGGSGLISGNRLRRLLDHDLGETRIESLAPRFAAVATELVTGHEIWLSAGPLVQALCASYALPGVIDPVQIGGRWLMDGALVNPVPVTVARALGASLVICVNLNNEPRTRGTVIQSPAGRDAVVQAVAEAPQARRLLPAFLDRGVLRRTRRSPDVPGVAGVMIDAFNITQDRISRSRLAGDPPDVMVSPRLAATGLFEFHRAAECIELGRQAAERAMPEIRDALASAPPATRASAAQAAVM